MIVVFSVLLWVFVSFSGEFSITLNLPIHVVDVPSQYSVSSISTQNVSISLKGQGWQLAQHTLGRDPKFFIPCPNETGDKEVTARNVLGANNWLSSTLQLAEITPENINIKVEKKISKKVEILPVLALSYKPGYDLVSPIKIEPDSVEVSGPISLVNSINIINTENFAITNLEEESSITLAIKQQNFIETDINECKISFDVQKIVDKSFEDIVIETRNIPPRYELILSPSKVTAVIRGGISQLSKMKNKDLHLYVNFNQAINDTTGAIEPFLEIPKFTSLIDIKPNRLEYIIKKY